MEGQAGYVDEKIESLCGQRTDGPMGKQSGELQ
jgi:hypothetical protein